MPYEALGSLSGLDRDAIMTLYSAFSNDPDALDRAVTEDWQDIPLAPGQGPGREAMKPMIRAFNAAFPDARITIHEIIGAPGKAAERSHPQALGEAPRDRVICYAQGCPAASRIRSATSRGRDSSDTWLAASSTVFAPIRFAMNR